MYQKSKGKCIKGKCITAKNTPEDVSRPPVWLLLGGLFSSLFFSGRSKWAFFFFFVWGGHRALGGGQFRNILFAFFVDFF